MGWCKYQSWTLYIINSYKFQVIYSYVEGYVGRLAGSLVGNRRIGRSEKRETCKSESTVPPLVHIETVSFNPKSAHYILPNRYLNWMRHIIYYIYIYIQTVSALTWKSGKYTNFLHLCAPRWNPCFLSCLGLRLWKRLIIKKGSARRRRLVKGHDFAASWWLRSMRMTVWRSFWPWFTALFFAFILYMQKLQIDANSINANFYPP